MRQSLVWAEIDLGAIEHNVHELMRITSPAARFMAVVKAYGYGHGAVQVAQRAMDSGALALGVARFHEGVQLRKAGIDAPILILGYTPPELTDQLAAFDLTQAVYSYKTAAAMDRVAAGCGKSIKIHIKIDTGMGRLGLPAPGSWEKFAAASSEPYSDSGSKTEDADTIDEIAAIYRLKHIQIEGIYTHFASSDSFDKTYASMQLHRFFDVIRRLSDKKIHIPIKHAANSGAIIDLPEAHLDMVRAGISLYGLYPSDEVKKNRLELRPAMTLKTRIIFLKNVPAGFSISYGMTYKTPKPTTIATVCVGYADGLNRLLTSRGSMLVRGQRAPIVGRVCMDLTMLDVGHINDVEVGDEVVIFGRQGSRQITVDEIASSLNTINYEVVSTITRRVPRVYH